MSKEFSVERECVEYTIDTFYKDFEILKSYCVGCIEESIKIVNSNTYCVDLVFIIPPFTKRILSINIEGITSRSVMDIHEIFYKLNSREYIGDNITNIKHEILKILDTCEKPSFPDHLFKEFCISENPYTDAFDECKFIEQDASSIYKDLKKIPMELARKATGKNEKSNDRLVILSKSFLHGHIKAEYEEFNSNYVKITLNVIPIIDIIRNNIAPYSMYISLDVIDVDRDINYKHKIILEEIVSIKELNKIIDNIYKTILTDENIFRFCVTKLLRINIPYTQKSLNTEVRNIIEDTSICPSDKSNILNELYLDTYDFVDYEYLFLDTEPVDFYDVGPCIVGCISTYSSDILSKKDLINLVKYRKYPPRSVFTDFINATRVRGIDTHTYEWNYYGATISYDSKMNKTKLTFTYQYIKNDVTFVHDYENNQKRYYREWRE